MAKLTRADAGPVVQIPPFFSDRVVERVLRATLHTAKSGGGQSILMKTEIHTPDKVTVGDKEYVLAGQVIERYLSLNPTKSEGAKQSGWAGTCAFLEKVGLSTDLDPEDPKFNDILNEMFKDLAFENILRSSERVMTRTLPNGDREPICDGRGNPIKSGFQWNTFLNDVLGRCSVESNVPY